MTAKTREAITPRPQRLLFSLANVPSPAPGGVTCHLAGRDVFPHRDGNGREGSCQLPLEARVNKSRDRGFGTQYLVDLRDRKLKSHVEAFQVINSISVELSPPCPRLISCCLDDPSSD